jgi:hypothetical protein
MNFQIKSLLIINSINPNNDGRWLTKFLIKRQKQHSLVSWFLGKTSIQIGIIIAWIRLKGKIIYSWFVQKKTD